MRKTGKPFHWYTLPFTKIWAGVLIFILVICSFSGCTSGYFLQHFPLPLENDKIYWGIQAAEFQTVMKKFDYPLAVLEQNPQGPLHGYTVDSPLKTYYGQAAASQFLFNEEDKLVKVRFFFADLSFADLHAVLTTQYGELEKVPTPAFEEASSKKYSGDYYIPDDATAEDLSEKEYQKMKSYLMAHPDILHSSVTTNAENLEKTVDDFLKNASVFVLKTGEYLDAETGKAGAFVEVNGEYLTLLSLLP